MLGAHTLALAYAGASLPLMILLSSSPQPLSNVLTSEVISAEIVRTLVGSIGLIASVPITTALAAACALPGAVDALGCASGHGEGDGDDHLSGHALLGGQLLDEPVAEPGRADRSIRHGARHPPAGGSVLAEERH